jgi:hypothetical protein
MSGERRRPLDQYLKEAVVIVGSILLAFAIDAWWEGRGEAERREALLEGLAADFALAEEQLDLARRAHGEVREVAARWLVLARSGSPAGDHVAVADTLVSEMAWTLVTRPPMGTLDALLQSGDLSLIKNPGLLGALTNWSSTLEYLNDFERTGADQWYEDVTPYLRRAGIPITDLVWTRRGTPNVYPVEPRRTEVHRLLVETEWESIVQARWYIYEDVLLMEEQAREQLDLIRGLLREELGS